MLTTDGHIRGLVAAGKALVDVAVVDERTVVDVLVTD